MANVNVGRRTPKQDAEALKELEDAAKSGGEKVIEEDGAKFVVSTSFGMTVKTRIA